MLEYKSPLEKILDIDKKVSQLKRNTNYIKIRKGMKKMEGFNQGNRFISIPSPHDLEKDIRIRKRSNDLKQVKKMYKKRLDEFKEKIDTLLNEKAVLEKQIFG